ncbi:hypothetical protein [Lignipirellula cremea]|uniref:Uncharacterized protein n=1 Tax=Lignipirellula cremea TaxID=2528010 RepID=A0A518DVZ2_9BACT|nr:hypothetical protein [Lignipirellula cremea]QDU95993.1 hypothetical protein Pla8534_38120 [Lignipirellula cremea]
MKVKEGGFEFQEEAEGWGVFYRRKRIGEIVGMKEPSGRHCFRLGCDTRKEPRTYRGKVKAAEALLSLSQLQREAAKKKWSPEMLILSAWDNRPRVSESV